MIESANSIDHWFVESLFTENGNVQYYFSKIHGKPELSAVKAPLESPARLRKYFIIMLMEMMEKRLTVQLPQ
ncbi:MAG: hypothetical protein K1X68_11870 [Saprospiraceae bacterium]|nr:hypothetical protein [Saprospiraceae bacterium]HMW40591.1 hypothetical protein [Saprospiraceae bacterium]HMX89423.1 hypothetical protein [Saprospiraceae bacterium]HMZ40040.1 hypothetical protein [Saprospiraceae bacterium]HNA65741.1 hypothetical protein [Saprospiraceae bacterium]